MLSVCLSVNFGVGVPPGPVQVLPDQVLSNQVLSQGANGPQGPVALDDNDMNFASRSKWIAWLILTLDGKKKIIQLRI